MRITQNHKQQKTNTVLTVEGIVAKFLLRCSLAHISLSLEKLVSFKATTTSSFALSNRLIAKFVL